LALLGGVVMAGPPPEPTLLPSTGLRQTEVWTPPRISATHPELTRIVLDPGHGGHDPGAGAGHLNEAAIVLDVAIRLEAKLREQTGIEVVMTRRDDVYLPLRARTSLANCVGADLFLSIHANASRDQVASGIATYHLRGAAPTTTTTTTAAARIIHAGACRAR
jgi:N-acetylmuramoyl-L-alanine amidase